MKSITVMTKIRTFGHVYVLTPAAAAKHHTNWLNLLMSPAAQLPTVSPALQRRCEALVWRDLLSLVKSIILVCRDGSPYVSFCFLFSSGALPILVLLVWKLCCPASREELVTDADLVSSRRSLFLRAHGNHHSIVHPAMLHDTDLTICAVQVPRGATATVRTSRTRNRGTAVVSRTRRFESLILATRGRM